MNKLFQKQQNNAPPQSLHFKISHTRFFGNSLFSHYASSKFACNCSCIKLYQTLICVVHKVYIPIHLHVHVPVHIQIHTQTPIHIHVHIRIHIHIHIHFYSYILIFFFGYFLISTYILHTCLDGKYVLIGELVPVSLYSPHIMPLRNRVQIQFFEFNGHGQ